jgi:hypothetical protein
MSQGSHRPIGSALGEPHVPAPIWYAGAFIRYAFYLLGALVFAVILIGVLSVSKTRVKRVEQQPAFRLDAAELARMPVRSHVITGHGARMEVRQHGQLHDRDADMTIALVMPPRGWPGGNQLGVELANMGPARLVSWRLTQAYYDLDTRFGPVRAAEMTVDADGRRKLCLGFLSRFDSTAVYLKGWHCEASGTKASPDNLACILDRLVLDSRLSSAAADAFLRERAARKAFCAARPVTQTTDTGGRRPSSPARWSAPQAQQRRY